MLEANVYHPSVEVNSIVPPEDPTAIVLAVEDAFTGEFANLTMLRWQGIVEELTGEQASPPAHPPAEGPKDPVAELMPYGWEGQVANNGVPVTPWLTVGSVRCRGIEQVRVDYDIPPAYGDGYGEGVEFDPTSNIRDVGSVVACGRRVAGY